MEFVATLSLSNRVASAIWGSARRRSTAHGRRPRSAHPVLRQRRWLVPRYDDGGALFGVAVGVESRLRRPQVAIDRYLQDGEIVMVPAYDAGNLAAGMVLKIEY